MKSRIMMVMGVLLVASPAFAAVQNVKVSGSIDSSYISRNHFGLGAKTADIEQGVVSQRDFITQTAVQVDADLSDNVSTQVSIYNERAWDAENSASENSTSGNNADQNTNIQLQYANVTLKEFLYSPLTLTVGRQDISYGNSLIIGAAPAAGNMSTIATDMTMRSAFDGVRAVLDYKPLTLDLMYFRNSSSSTHGGALSNDRDNDDVYGANANYQIGDASNTVVEAYLFGRNNRNVFNSAHQADSIYVPGGRVSTNPIKGLNVQAELAWQLGSKTFENNGRSYAAKRDAMAMQFMGNYEIAPLEKYKAAVNASYTVLSGDQSGTAFDPANLDEERYSAWDPMMEDQNTGRIFDNIFNNSNLRIVNAGVSANPVEDITTKLNWYGVWADKKYNADNALGFAQPDGTSVTPATTGRKDLGNEFDLDVDYAYTEDVTIGLTVGYFLPGKAFDGANDSTASQAVAHVAVAF